MSASGPSGQWRAAGASVMGAAHKRRGLPNQDAHLAQPETGTAGELFISVADGHGGAEYVRSDIGAGLAVQALRRALEWFPEEAESLSDFKADVVSIWRSLVQEHIETHPLHDMQQARPKESQFAIYGTTLIAVAANQKHLLALQLGDGDLVLGYPDGRIETPLQPEEELPGEQTHSICQSGADEFMRAVWLTRNNDHNWPHFALIATDGVSKSFVDQAAFLNAAREYRDIACSAEDLDHVATDLPDWLRTVSDNGSGDDASLCLAKWSETL